MVSLNKPKTKHNDASEIARKQNEAKVYTVNGDWSASATVSGRAWEAGQKISKREDVIPYFRDAASNELDDKDLPIVLTDAELLNCINRVDPDRHTSEETEETIVEMILSAQKDKHGPLSIAIVQRNEDIESIAALLAPALGAELGSGWKANLETKYKAAELANIIVNTLPAEKLASIPQWDAEPPKGEKKANPNANYNRRYRSRAATDYGPVSWIGDLYDEMPDVKGFTLGQSIKEKMWELNPDHQTKKDMKGKEKKQAWDMLVKQRTNGIKNLTDAVRLVQRMALINTFRLVKCSFRTNEHGETDLQNLNPIRVEGYREEREKDKQGKETGKPTGKLVLVDYDYYPCSKVWGWEIENLSRTTTSWGTLTTADKERDPMGKPIGKSDEARLYLKKVASWFGPAVGTASGRRTDFEMYIYKIENGKPKDEGFVHDMLGLIRFLKPYEKVLEALDATSTAGDDNERAELIARTELYKAGMQQERSGKKAA